MEMSTPSVNSVGVNPNGHEPVASAPIAMTHAAGPAGNGARSLTTRPVVSPMGGVPALPPASSARADHDEITRRRDEHGNRLGWVFWHSIPTASDVPLLESYVEHALAVVEEAGLVGCAHNLRFFYEQKLRGAIQRLK